MTADSGYIICRFGGTAEVMEAFRGVVARTDRQNRFSCGLSWLDELDCEGEAESEAVSYDTIDCTREFLESLLARLPGLEFEGALAHGWPVLPGKKTLVEFRSAGGALLWDERQEEESEDDFLSDFEYGEDEDEEVFIPTTPY